VEGGVTKDGKTSSFNGLIGEQIVSFLFIKIGFFLGKNHIMECRKNTYIKKQVFGK
jgi:hypothetical protein